MRWNDLISDVLNIRHDELVPGNLVRLIGDLVYAELYAQWPPEMLRRAAYDMPNCEMVSSCLMSSADVGIVVARTSDYVFIMSRDRGWAHISYFRKCVS